MDQEAPIYLQIKESDDISVVLSTLQEDKRCNLDGRILLWAGKQLHRGLTIADYGIYDGCTLHLVYRPKDDPRYLHNTPYDEILPTGKAAQSKSKDWKSKAALGDFDDDLHIVDPHAYYARLDTLERHVTESSEYFQCGGTYDLANQEVPEWAFPRKLGSMSDWMWEKHRVNSEWLSLSQFFEVKRDARKHVTASIWKTYTIVCNVLENLEFLDRQNFCISSSYSLLVKHREYSLAELVQVPRSLIAHLRDNLESAATLIHRNSLEPDSSYAYLPVCVLKPSEAILDHLGLSHPAPSSGATLHILKLCRTTALLMDLALVSYVGSHGTRFDKSFLNPDDQPIDPQGITIGDFFSCDLRRLACLDGFLDQKKVWVFQQQCKPVSVNTSCPPADQLSLRTIWQGPKCLTTSFTIFPWNVPSFQRLLSKSEETHQC